jgi:hypothetical protein
VLPAPVELSSLNDLSVNYNDMLFHEYAVYGGEAVKVSEMGFKKFSMPKTLLSILFVVYLIVFVIVDCTPPGELNNPEYLISANSSDTCAGSYKEEINSVINRPIENITINEIAFLRCLRFQAKTFGDSTLSAQYRQAVADSNFKEIVRLGQELLKEDFANPRLHDMIANAAKKLGMADIYDYHVKYVIKHFKSFAVLGNGESFESPLQAFAIGEEYEWLSLMEYRRGMQSKEVKNGRHYDVHECRDKQDTGVKVYFDITGYWYYYHKMFMKAMMNKDSANSKPTIIIY